MRNRATTIALLFATCAGFSQTSKQKTILTIVAHPDDENMIGDVLARYERLGSKVYVIIATDGKEGTRITKIPAGDSLAKLRRQESICACEKLGIQPPLFLGIERLDTKIGVRQYLDGRKILLQELKHKIDSLHPDILLTFGPDGEYGHSEHIVIGAAVMEILLREAWVDKYPLYFPADTKEDVSVDEELSWVDQQYLNVMINYTDEDEQKSFEAAKCYGTQSRPEEVTEWIDSKTKDKSNRKFFRRLYVKKEMKNDFFNSR